MKRAVVVPVYNEEQNVVEVLGEVADYADLIVIVDDGSTDASRRMITEWGKGREDVWFLSLGTNQGKASALRCGFHLICHLLETGELVGDDVVVTIDADRQHNTGEIRLLDECLVNGNFDMVTTSRDFSLYPLGKRLGNRLMSMAASLFALRYYEDIESGFKCLRASVVPELLKYYTGLRYSSEQEIGVIVARRGFRIKSDWVTAIMRYQSNTRLKDVAINLLGGLLAAIRVTIGLSRDIDADVKRSLGYVVIMPSERKQGGAL